MPDGTITERGQMIMTNISQRYISFMRGENPKSFPVRLFPTNIPTISAYPANNPSGVEIPEDEKLFYKKLPIVPIPLKGDALRASEAFMRELAPSDKLSPFSLEKMVHAGNIVVPGDDNNATMEAWKDRTDKYALTQVFDEESVGRYVRYRAKEKEGARWLGIDQLGTYSPKFEFLINRVRQAEGCIFVYTRFVNAGALPLALALEANGYMPYGRDRLLADGIQTAGGRQCAMCPRREKDHDGQDHEFTQAYYGILTGELKISPNNEETINAQRDIKNANGAKMKIIIGSQIASEGVDLKFIRETHVIDSWFHLNKTEQILGRAIRFLSHCALPKEKRNNTVYLYAATLPPSYQRESADLYSYRFGFKKALLIGRVTRVIKQASLDCNLNKNAIVIQGEKPIIQVDAQNQVRNNVNINDMPYSAVCDWIETCEYECRPKINVKELQIDDSTYDEFAARWRVHKLKERIRKMFALLPFYLSEDMWASFDDTPRIVFVDLLTEIVDNKNFQVQHKGINGYIRYCNGYYLFQPNVYADLTIPLAIRTASFPIKRDMFAPVEYEEEEVVEKSEEKNKENVETIKNFWEFIQDWTTKLSRTKEYGKDPLEIEQRIIDMSQGDNEIKTAREQNIEAIKWFHLSFHKSTNKNEDSYRKLLLRYFWDEWLTLEEQKYLVFKSGLNVQECIRDNQYLLGKDTLVIRFVNPSEDTIEYYCEGATKCQEAIVRGVQQDRDKKDLIAFNKQHIGELYGFIVPKNRKFVFKTDTIKENSPIRGQECANSTNMPPKTEKLLMLGNILKTANRTDFDLNEISIAIHSGLRPLKAAGRACTLIDLVLRYLDAERIQNKRWFFRPLKAYLLTLQQKKSKKK
jgi:hypothetical protein